MTILRYPGGKSRATKFILPLLLKNLEENEGLLSPFFGGGAIELALMKRRPNVNVHANDIFEPVYNFWKSLKTRRSEVVNAVMEHYPISKRDFQSLQRDLREIEDDAARAAAYYVLNRCSFSGRVDSGFSSGHPRFTATAITKLTKIDLSSHFMSGVDAVHFLRTFRADKLAYIDPPYAVDGELYGANSVIDHVELADCLKNRCRWVLSYNDCPEIRELYKDYQIRELRWKYSFANAGGKEQGQRVELLITDDVLL